MYSYSSSSDVAGVVDAEVLGVNIDLGDGDSEGSVSGEGSSDGDGCGEGKGEEGREGTGEGKEKERSLRQPLLRRLSSLALLSVTLSLLRSSSSSQLL